jgi:hypothetical protein
VDIPYAAAPIARTVEARLKVPAPDVTRLLGYAGAYELVLLRDWLVRLSARPWVPTSIGANCHRVPLNGWPGGHACACRHTAQSWTPPAGLTEAECLTQRVL